MSGNWIAVACAEHVRRGRAGGFMQVCHGKAAPLRRIRAGDRVAYYAPTETMGGGARLQEFVALGIVADGEPYEAQMGDFRPYRRDVAWLDVQAAPIAPLLGRLAFTRARNWGTALRRGLVAIAADDMALIAAAMAVALPLPPPLPLRARTAACAAAPGRAG
jgi:hypothetical protein